MKQLWNILIRKSTPWVKWFNLKYIRNRSIWSLPMPCSPSWAARSIIKARSLAMPHTCYLVSPTSNLKFWSDPWLPNGPITSQPSFGSIINFIPPNATIQETFEKGWWNMIQLLPHFSELKALTDSALLTSKLPSKVIWKPDSNGLFSLSSAWNTIRTKNHHQNWSSSIWFPGHIPKFSTTSWLAIQGKLSTRDRLSFQGPLRDTLCSLCNVDSESHNHLFFSCSYSAWIWQQILWRISNRKKQRKSIGEEEDWIRGKFKMKGQTATLARILFTATIHFIWLERNRRVHENQKKHKHYILKSILSATRDRILFLKLDDSLSMKIKLNTDASLTGDDGGIGGILRNDLGLCSAMFSLNCAPAPIHLLEIDAIINDVLLAESMNIKNLWIESDSLTAVKVVQNSSPCPWKKMPDLEHLAERLSGFDNWSITHIWREGNRAADFLSKISCPCKGLPIPPSVIPHELNVILLKDSSGVCNHFSFE
ncbi:uncharacterized protein LOC143891825 [Tasmannia lanceolata]|uniref:uncharacterized protein LOC143891825 n=1 Tax=Tasmannia lanceolata TaxID=3420 RepID=UPI0040643681